MTDPKDKDQRTKIPYEPPRLFDLGGGVAYAAVPCSPGGSPTTAKCENGGAATGSGCSSGTMAGGQCKSGSTAIGGKCKVGNTPA